MPPHADRILVVDDSKVVRVVLMEYLRAGGFEVDDAADGATALEMLAGGAYGVVITDLGMPGLDGFELLGAAKMLARGIEVIVLTGAYDQDASAAIRALRLGAHDYITKPPRSGDEVVLSVERALEKRQLRQTNRLLLSQLETLALSDALTGVPNRRAFEHSFVQEVARAHRYGHSLGLLCLDIDHFKRVNDGHGHPAGDEVLRQYAQIVTSALREGDALYRCGGEEFAVLLPQADPAGAVLAGQRIVERVARSPIALGTLALSITTSAGAVCLAVGESGTDLLSRGDAALYQAKSTGRNRVCSSQSPAA